MSPALNIMVVQDELQTLMQEARTMATNKGHDMGEFHLIQIDTGSPPVASESAMAATCEKCGAYVGIDPFPPNGLPKLWGNALKIGCKSKKKE
jgi:hypothetical protein